MQFCFYFIFLHPIINYTQRFSVPFYKEKAIVPAKLRANNKMLFKG